jgi:hypothetical protein
MSDEISQYRNRFLETASMTIVAGDQSPAIPVDLPSPRFVEINSMSIDVVNRVFNADDTLYPTAMLAELSALVHSLRAASPESALAAVADAKIERIIALGGGTLGQGRSDAGSKGISCLVEG